MDICNLGVDDEFDLFNALKLTDDEMVIAKLILKEIMARLGFMSNVGLSYLNYHVLQTLSAVAKRSVFA